MKKIAGIITMLLALTAGLSSCLKDKNSDCPEIIPSVALRFVFTHHDETEEVTDLFRQYVDDVHLYIFDADGNYLRHLDIPQLSLEDGNLLPLDIDPGDYKMVAWGNLYGTGYEFNVYSGDDGDDLTVKANENHTGVADLFHGTDHIKVDSTFYIHDISLIRNTHFVRIKLLGLSDPSRSTIEGTDYSVVVEGSNIIYDFENNPAAGDATATYTPTYSGFYEENTYVAQAEFKVQRLIVGGDLTLQIFDGEQLRREDNVPNRIMQAYEDIETNEDLDKHYVYELYYEIDRYGGWIFVGNSLKDWDGSSMPGEL